MTQPDLLTASGRDTSNIRDLIIRYPARRSDPQTLAPNDRVGRSGNAMLCRKLDTLPTSVGTSFNRPGDLHDAARRFGGSNAQHCGMAAAAPIASAGAGQPAYGREIGRASCRER